MTPTAGKSALCDNCFISRMMLLICTGQIFGVVESQCKP